MIVLLALFVKLFFVTSGRIACVLGGVSNLFLIFALSGGYGITFDFLREISTLIEN